MPKITRVTLTTTVYKKDEPIIFEGALADDIAVLHGVVHFMSSSDAKPKLVLTCLEGAGKIRKHRFIAARADQEHPDLCAEEYVTRAGSFISTTKTLHTYYLFAAPVATRA